MVTLISARVETKMVISMASTKGQIAARVDEDTLAQIKEIEKETALIANRYADPSARTVPVAVVFVVPESMTRAEP